MTSPSGKPRLLMVPPDHYGIDYVINPWMEGNVGRADQLLAIEQWRTLRQKLSNLVEIVILDPSPGIPDMVFTANAGLVAKGIAVPSRFYYRERSPEEARFTPFFESQGFALHPLPGGFSFEGAGDALFDLTRPLLFAGYGFRTALESHPHLAASFDVEVVSLRLVDPRFYHLDTCFAPLPDGGLLWYRGAFDHRSNELIESLIPLGDRIEINEEEALQFVANMVIVRDRVFLSSCSGGLCERLSKRGLTVEVTELTEFIKAGGSARCLTLPLDQEVPVGGKANSTVAHRKLEATGHLLDTGALSHIIDSVKASGGSLALTTITPGDRKSDPSTALLDVTAPDNITLDTIISLLAPLGVSVPLTEEKDATLLSAPAMGVAPDLFYATTIYPTRVRLAGEWVAVKRQRMDGVIVIDDVPRVSLMRDLRKGDLVVCGGAGIRVETPHFVGGGSDEFSFMRSEVSSERRVAGAVEQVAWEMRRAKERGGKIVVVTGPVVVHTGGVPPLCRLVREGYISALLGGNAIAVHDVEMAIYGTSLGVKMKTGKPAPHGHRNHLSAINTIRREGSLTAAVEGGVLRSGLMHELIRKQIPFSLAGSIRDDGPLPETEMDLVAAQADYTRLLKGADIILAFATMLHAIGVGNMTPAGVKFFAIDINPAVVTKLADRGSLESVGIVTDTGLFLDLLATRLCGEGEK